MNINDEIKWTKILSICNDIAPKIKRGKITIWLVIVKTIKRASSDDS